MREELLEVAGQIVQKSVAATQRQERTLPADEEIDAMAAFTSQDHECEVLCQEYLDTAEELQGAVGLIRQRLLARLRALRVRMRELHCRPCLPQ
jgi:hypothetical protein